MNKKHIIIQQTLHGYSNGHHLLESSILLSDESKRKLDMLSDFSSVELSEGFESYFTGYFLENENLIVLAKTWYAHEMTRPGCVWTHSLLINFDDLIFCSYSINHLLSLFKRPNKELTQKAYDIPSDNYFEIESIVFDDKKIQYLVWVMLGQEPPNFILANNSEEYIRELLFIWFTCYKELSTDFTFITGTTSIKSGNTNVISLQFVSKNTRNMISHLSNNIRLMKNIDEVQKFPPWVISASNLIMEQEWNKFTKFKNMFSTENNCNLSLTMFVKLYSCFYNSDKTIDIYSSLELIDKVFETEKTDIGNKLLNFYLEGKFENWGTYHSFSNLIIASLKFQWISLSVTTLEELIKKALETDNYNSKKIVHYLANLDNPEIQEKYLTPFASLLTPKDLESFSDMDYSVCNVLVAINPELAKSNAIWAQTFGFQQGIFDCLKMCKDITLLDKNLMEVVLSTSMFDFANEIYLIWKEDSVQVFINYLLNIKKLRHNFTEKMFELCRLHSNIAIQQLVNSYKNFSSQQLLVFLKIINPYYDNVSFETLINVFPLLKIKTLNEHQINEVADWYLPFIIRNNFSFSEEIVVFSVLNVHERLANLSYPEEKWRSLQKLLPVAGYFNQWDKCKRLRKALKKKGIKVKELNNYTDDEMDIHLL